MTIVWKNHPALGPDVPGPLGGLRTFTSMWSKFGHVTAKIWGSQNPCSPPCGMHVYHRSPTLISLSLTVTLSLSHTRAFARAASLALTHTISPTQEVKQRLAHDRLATDHDHHKMMVESIWKEVGSVVP